MVGRVRVWMILAAAANAFAGCSHDGPGPAATDSSTATDSTTTATTTAAPGPGANSAGENAAPELVFDARVSGDDPFNITFRLDIGDADGDEVHWTITLDGDAVIGDGFVAGNGTATDFFVADAPGPYTFTAEATDATHVTAVNATVAIAGAAGSQTVAASYVAGIEACLATAYDAAGTVPLAGVGVLDGITRVEFALEPTTVGLPWKVSWHFDTGFITVYTAFTMSTGSIVQGTLDDGANFGGVEQIGTVPEGAEVVVLLGCGGPVSAGVTYEA